MFRSEDRRYAKDRKANQVGLSARARSLRHRRLRRHVLGGVDRGRCENDEKGSEALGCESVLSPALRLDRRMGRSRKLARLGFRNGVDRREKVAYSDGWMGNFGKPRWHHRGRAA